MIALAFSIALGIILVPIIAGALGAALCLIAAMFTTRGGLAFLATVVFIAYHLGAHS